LIIKDVGDTTISQVHGYSRHRSVILSLNKVAYPLFSLVSWYRGAQCPDNSASENVARVVPVLTVIAESTSWETSNDSPLKGSCKSDAQVCE